MKTEMRSSQNEKRKIAQADRDKQRYEKRRAAGLCVYCGIRPSRLGLLRCEKCTEKDKKFRVVHNAKPEIKAQKKAANIIRVARSIDLGSGYSITQGQADHWLGAYRLTPADVLKLYLEQDKRCIYGGDKLDWPKFHIDHIHGYPGCKEDIRGRDYGCPSEAVRGLSCEEHNKLEGIVYKYPQVILGILAMHAEERGEEPPCFAA